MLSKNTHRFILWLLYLNCFILTTACAQSFNINSNYKKSIYTIPAGKEYGNYSVADK